MLNNLRAGFLELCASCFQYLEMGQLLPPSTSQHIGRFSCELPGLGRLSVWNHLLNSGLPNPPPVKYLRNYSVFEMGGREKGQGPGPAGSARVLDNTMQG